MLVYKKEKQIIHGESDRFLFLLFKESVALRIAPLLRSSRNSDGHSESADLPCGKSLLPHVLGGCQGDWRFHASMNAGLFDTLATTNFFEPLLTLI